MWEGPVVLYSSGTHSGWDKPTGGGCFSFIYCGTGFGNSAPWWTVCMCVSSSGAINGWLHAGGTTCPATRSVSSDQEFHFYLIPFRDFFVLFCFCFIFLLLLFLGSSEKGMLLEIKIQVNFCEDLLGLLRRVFHRWQGPPALDCTQQAPAVGLGEKKGASPGESNSCRGFPFLQANQLWNGPSNIIKPSLLQPLVILSHIF